MKLASVLAAVLALAMAGCTYDTSYDQPTPKFDVTSIPKEIDARGVSFGVGGIPGEKDAIALRVNFKIASTDDAAPPVTDAIWMEAAQKAAPKGCTVKALTPLPDGSRKAEYAC